MDDVDFIRARVKLAPKRVQYQVQISYMLFGRNAVWNLLLRDYACLTSEDK